MKVAVTIVLLALAFPALGSRRSLKATSDADILNFALNLEYLEAQFYSWAAYGKGLDSSLLGRNPGPVTGGKKANLTGAVSDLALQLADNEIAHVKFLRNALGAAAVDQPALNIGSAFANGLNAAFGSNLSPPFDPYLNNLFFLHGAFLFEDLGVTAYKGAAPSIYSSQILDYAAGILATEAYHGGTIRSLLCDQRDAPTPYGFTPQVITQKIADLYNQLGTVKASSGITTLSNGQAVCNASPTDANALAFSRTPAQVLAIATGGGAGGKGLFFPNGLNGALGASWPAPANGPAPATG